MPHYFLSVRYRGRLFRDEEGEDIPSAIEMKVRALETARDLIRTPFLAIPDWLDCTLEVTDETGAMVLSLPFPDAVDAWRTECQLLTPRRSLRLVLNLAVPAVRQPKFARIEERARTKTRGCAGRSKIRPRGCGN